MDEASASLSGEAQGSGSLIRVFILDDHELVRRGLRELLAEEGFEVVGDTGSAQDATERILALRPDVAILDGRLPDGTGVEVCRNVRSTAPAVQCLILTSYDDDQARSGAVLAGAAGYVLKEIHSADLLDKIRRAAAHETLFDPRDRARIFENLADPNLRDPRSAPLTDQERRVLSLIGEGLTNREISNAMFLTEKTVKNYVSSMLAKMGFHRRTQAAVFVARGGDKPRR
ncbi:two component transcriptional regulator, LuxR family [Cryobacterium psychrotolerans]|uniref:Two component transcriptional regulator, LuxR family n=1 Tax=Cryobacterium psychrotolerans TaxID=386301 RepID=A0A1G9BSK5_9MICO|nr:MULTISPECIES: response regulator transcription factor [Cryobacterium]TFD42965.1 response regulator transcription factor [Cryobacterium sp. TMT1-2-1]TFD84077.1 response regulator transcription factor [Cryobacterium psychrotolerans]SDK42416.1 two component transcriptional regulator, LuxR family [Cryobacterium psychrotolerans]